MLCRYEFPVRAICPVNPKTVDCYSVTVDSHSEVRVEDLLEFAKGLDDVKATQEEITQAFSARFPGCTVTSIGWHSGAKTTVIAGKSDAEEI